MTIVNKPRITLEFESGADPIRGSVLQADGSRQPFWGWLELSEKLRRVASDGPDPQGEPMQTNPARSPDTDVGAKPQRPHKTTKEEP